MNPSAMDRYLETGVLTATPQKLQLMLIEGAVRFAAQARNCRQRNEDVEATEAISRCREIVSVILSGIKNDGTELTRNVTSVYVYLFRTLT